MARMDRAFVCETCYRDLIRKYIDSTRAGIARASDAPKQGGDQRVILIEGMAEREPSSN